MRAVVCGIALMFVATGCVYIPGPEVVTVYRNAEKFRPKDLAGDETSGKPIRPGVTRDQVRAVIGPPGFDCPDGRVDGYKMPASRGALFCLIPLGHIWGDHTPMHDFYLLASYDESDRLDGWKWKSGFQFDWERLGMESVSERELQQKLKGPATRAGD